ncbi:MAG: hypothetical protein CM15mP103_11230 [Gammaproteobacteria bacterium]|nr:MAG: hypothetical protein CM15mP103_11230 [Gammaproteobacteria bacterium]
MRDYAAILAFMLYENGFAASAVDLDLKSQLAPALCSGIRVRGGKTTTTHCFRGLSPGTVTEWLHHRGTPTARTIHPPI